MNLEKKLKGFIVGLTEEEKAEFDSMLLRPAMEGAFTGPIARKNLSEGMFTGASSSRQGSQRCQHCRGTGLIST